MKGIGDTGNINNDEGWDSYLCFDGLADTTERLANDSARGQAWTSVLACSRDERFATESVPEGRLESAVDARQAGGTNGLTAGEASFETRLSVFPHE